jgi:hypothetical protein
MKRDVGLSGSVSLVILLMAMLLSGCSTLSDVQRVKEEGSEGTTKTYPVTVDQAWDICKAVFRWEGCDAIEEHRADGYMLTSSGMNMVSVGAVMGAWVKPIDANNRQQHGSHGGHKAKNKVKPIYDADRGNVSQTFRSGRADSAKRREIALDAPGRLESNE